MAKEKPNEINLGEAFGPAVIRVNGLTIRTDGKGRTSLSHGNVTVDIRDGNISLSGGNIKVRDNGVARVVPVGDEAGVITSSLDMGGIKPGDVLGVEVVLPSDVKHLCNWFVYNVKKDQNGEGIVQAFEPECHLMSCGQFYNHVDHTLAAQGHLNARIMNERDATAIFYNVVQAGIACKSGIEIYNKDSKANPFWGALIMDDNIPTEACYIYHLGDEPADSVIESLYSAAYGLAVQDIPLRSLQP